MDVINYKLWHLRCSGDSCAGVGQVVTSASQCTVRPLFAVSRRNSARLLLDSTELDASELVAVTSTVSLQIAEGEQTRSTADQFGGLGSEDRVAVASVFEAVKGIATAGALAAQNEL